MYVVKKMTVTDVSTSIHSLISFAWVAEQEERFSSSLLGSGNNSPSSYLLLWESTCRASSNI